jgi:stearoyl-CoA desaturase (delta-9 desaturase)
MMVFSWGPVIIGFIFYQISGISITMGYHRLYSHKSYDAHPIIRGILLILGAGAVENSLLAWASDHRRHHAKVDTNEDPYNVNEGFFWAHMGWIMHKKQDDSSDAYGADLRADKMVMWQHKHYLLLAILVAGVIPFTLTWYLTGSWLGALALGVFGKTVLMHHCTFFINSLCHYAGKRPYTDINTARDSWWVALVSFGEGFHNYHHYFQTDYRNGIKWWHYDPSKWIVKILEYMGLAYNLKETPKERILAAELNMKMKKAKLKFGGHDRIKDLELMKQKVLESLKSFSEAKREMQKEFKKFKEELEYKKANLNMNDIKLEIKLKKREMKLKLQKARADLIISFEEFKLAVKALELSPSY